MGGKLLLGLPSMEDTLFGKLFAVFRKLYLISKFNTLNMTVADWKNYSSQVTSS
jgi:hypothetical protein